MQQQDGTEQQEVRIAREDDASVNCRWQDVITAARWNRSRQQETAAHVTAVGDTRQQGLSTATATPSSNSM